MPSSKFLKIELLVGGVDVVVGKAEAHHDAGQAEVAVEVADDGNGAAGADEDGVFAPDFVKSARGGLDVLVVDGNQAGVAGVDEADVDVDAGGGNLFDVALVLREGLGGRHAGDKAHGDLGEGLGGDDGFGAGAGEAAGDAVDVERGASPGALENAVAVFADELAGADFGDAVMLFVEGQALPGGEFLGAGRDDVVVKAGDAGCGRFRL